MADQRTDASLWLEAISGTESSFAVIFDRHRVRFFRYAYRHVNNVHDAEDVVGMVFLEAWRKRSGVRIVEGSLLPWLLSTTSYVVLNQRRAHRRYRRLLAKVPPSAEGEDHADSILDSLDADRRASALRAAMKRLNASERRILDLCALEGMPLSSVAAALDLPIGTVKSRLHRAKTKLREYLTEPDEHGVSVSPHYLSTTEEVN